MAPVVKNPTAELIDSINGLIESNKAIVNANKEQIETLWQIVVTGNPKEKIPSLIEVINNHQRKLDDWDETRKRVIWIVLGAAITAILGGGWYVALHVFGGVK